MVIEAVIVLLIFGVLAAGCFYAAVRWVGIRHERDTLQRDMSVAQELIGELEARVMLLEAERENEAAKSSRIPHTPQGYDVFNIRS